MRYSWSCASDGSVSQAIAGDDPRVLYELLPEMGGPPRLKSGEASRQALSSCLALGGAVEVTPNSTTCARSLLDASALFPSRVSIACQRRCIVHCLYVLKAPPDGAMSKRPATTPSLARE